MATITLRNVPEETVERLKKAARQSGLSMNRFLINKLSGEAGNSPYKPREFHDLDHLFGSLDEEEYQRLNQAIADQRQIDEELWS